MKCVRISLLCAALLIAQALGLVHRVWHSPLQVAPVTSSLKAALGEQATGHDCQLFDHITQANGLCSTLFCWSGLVARMPLVATSFVSLSTTVLLAYSARAPPVR